ncbi:hypothetical protein UFOVP469_8 [uncultured Caudovirales phage]|uniref:Uncharacterized protein n=1 Tax=uncultured Caudovirales phage TaxID=2100421 RepID=A0A6J5MBR2_9CAUD|nr:hypothetical protein UFOVP469_8 [uncultured Caudovirales phage]CAB4190123.1 hypothetical protein UFOVP1200_38 [uncultured Caudovirales phage]
MSKKPEDEKLQPTHVAVPVGDYNEMIGFIHANVPYAMAAQILKNLERSQGFYAPPANTAPEGQRTDPPTALQSDADDANAEAAAAKQAKATVAAAEQDVLNKRRRGANGAARPSRA